MAYVAKRKKSRVQKEHFWREDVIIRIVAAQDSFVLMVLVVLYQVSMIKSFFSGANNKPGIKCLEKSHLFEETLSFY